MQDSEVAAVLLLPPDALQVVSASSALCRKRHYVSQPGGSQPLAIEVAASLPLPPAALQVVLATSVLRRKSHMRVWSGKSRKHLHRPYQLLQNVPRKAANPAASTSFRSSEALPQSPAALEVVPTPPALRRKSHVRVWSSKSRNPFSSLTTQLGTPPARPSIVQLPPELSQLQLILCLLRSRVRKGSELEFD